jgi:hypothetical protein
MSDFSPDVEAQMREFIESKTHVIRYTTAPAVYDYRDFDTQDMGVVGKLHGKPLRRVRIGKERLDYQLGRYASGMYPVYDEAMFVEAVKPSVYFQPYGDPPAEPYSAKLQAAIDQSLAQRKAKNHD